MPRLKSSDPYAALLARRLWNGRLLGPEFSKPEAAVEWHGVMQAQDYAAAKWAVGRRVRGASDSDVESALDAGRVLRTHVLRPTWHFVLPADIRWMLELSAPRIRALMAYYDRKLQLSEAVFRRCNTVIYRALSGGAHLTRNELARVLSAARIEASGQRLGHLMMRAELEAIVCSGPRRGKQFTYALLDERAPATKSLSREAALAELARRYVRSHGPCSAHDFSWWSGLSVADARAGLETLRPELEPLEVENKSYWSLASERRVPSPRTPVVHLLPNYDEYVVAYKDQTPLGGSVAREARRREALIGTNGVLRNGKLVGGWRRTLETGAVHVELELLQAPDRATRAALSAEAQRYAAFLGAELRLHVAAHDRGRA